MSDELSEQAVESSAIGGWRVKAVFAEQDGRLTHELHLVSGESVRPLLRSLDAPVFQQLYRQGDDALLLTGMGDKRFWSASVAHATDAAGLDFDLACRASAGAAAIQVAYAVASGAEVEEGVAGALRLRTADAREVVLASLAIDGAAACTLRQEEGRLIVSAAQDAAARWAYSFRVADGS